MRGREGKRERRKEGAARLVDDDEEHLVVHLLVKHHALRQLRVEDSVEAQVVRVAQRSRLVGAAHGNGTLL